MHALRLVLEAGRLLEGRCVPVLPRLPRGRDAVAEEGQACRHEAGLRGLPLSAASANAAEEFGLMLLAALGPQTLITAEAVAEPFGRGCGRGVVRLRARSRSRPSVRHTLTVVRIEAPQFEESVAASHGGRTARAVSVAIGTE